MAFVIAELCHCPNCHNDTQNDRTVCMFVGEEVKFDTIAEGEENPIVDWIDENSFQWHRCSTEHMDIGSFQLSFHVVDDRHH